MPSEIEIARVYFINLAMRSDRLNHMRKQLEQCSWPTERIEALRLKEDPADLGIKVIPRLEGQRHFVGIWLSHRRALAAASERDEEGAFILLEDDVCVRPDIWGAKLSLSVNLKSDWEILLLSPRYRNNLTQSTKSEFSGRKWIKAPFGSQPVLLRSIRSSFVCSGAHFCVFRNRDVVHKVLAQMAACDQLYDVDLFYISRFFTYGVDDERVTTAHYGSDHG
jgi:GR25 family glycosyltransferase involved in LPS biosynthesis